MTRTTNKTPEMSADQRESFENQVRDLFSHAHWDTRKIARWAASAASGFGFLTEDEAHALILPIAEKINAEQRENARAAVTEWAERSRELHGMASRGAFGPEIQKIAELGKMRMR